MLIQANRITLGRQPESDFVGRNGTLLVKFPGAENHNKNVGTKDDPEWETVGTSWYQFEAWGDVAEKIMMELNEGDSFELKKGIHKIDKVKDKYFNKYTIIDYEKIERKYK